MKIASHLVGVSFSQTKSNQTSAWEALALGSIPSKGRVTSAFIAGMLLLLYTASLSNILDSSPFILHLKAGFNHLSWFVSVTFVIAYMLSAFLILRRTSGSAAHVLSASLLSYFPAALFLTIIAFSYKVLLMIRLPQLIVQAGFVILHVWQLAILAVGLTHATGAGYERSIPVVLSLLKSL